MDEESSEAGTSVHRRRYAQVCVQAANTHLLQTFLDFTYLPHSSCLAAIIVAVRTSYRRRRGLRQACEHMDSTKDACHLDCRFRRTTSSPNHISINRSSAATYD
ncbi:hypothetical protein PHSY_001276 [Pseudozyma hubeiensis SY62]|uniref:Uncharacterized protein n=1 Tax=Pseudozyma hubeiensis (strain SY62) TaxID=1305764 RepID=R9NYG3_PSEHS|nr:hypothetical protein PHSY_001276 [Pseudozyma hubeiensis SY62]GAC93711.1 hypothetical protein PHSY_001276 [Pseudozyma hubeiensis SY62]